MEMKIDAQSLYIQSDLSHMLIKFSLWLSFELCGSLCNHYYEINVSFV
jgi:hypothetical protein